MTGDTDVSTMRDGSTASVFDAWGRRTTLTEVTPLPDYQTTLTSKRYFATDAEGNILSRRDGTMENGVFTQSGNGSTATPYNPAPDFITAAQWNAMTEAQRKSWQGKGMNQHFAYVNGQQLGRVNEAGLLDAASRLTAFDSSDTGTGQTSVTDGDTLQSIAERVYGNGSLWYILADANAVTDQTIFTGQILKVPQVQTNKNDASTFKPYNPAEATGPTAPSTPYIAHPQPHECNLMASIIRVFATLICAYVGPAAWALAMGGEAAAQNIEIDDGDRQGYDLGTIGATGLMAAFGGKLPGGDATSFLGKAAYAAEQVILSRAVGYGINRTLGREDHWNWRSVAVSAVAAGITAGFLGKSTTVEGSSGVQVINGKVATVFDWKDVLRAAGQAVSREVIGYGAQKLIMGEAHWSMRSLANNVANSLAAVAGQALRARHDADVMNRQLQRMTPEQRAAKLGALGDWRAADVARRSQLIAQEIDERRALESANPQCAVASAPGTPEELLPDLGVTRRMRGGGYETTYRNHYEDPYLIERNGGSADYVATVRTFPVDDLWFDPAYQPRASQSPQFSVVPPVAESSWLDQALVGVTTWARDLRETSRQNIYNSDSPGLAAVNSVLYAINAVSSTVLGEGAQGLRVFTNQQQREQVIGGLKVVLTTDPRETAAAGWEHFSNLEFEDQLVGAAGFISTLGVGTATKVTKLESLGSQLRAMDAAIPDIANNGRYLRVSSDGVRGEAALSATQRAEVSAYLGNFDLDGVVVRHVDDTNLNTGYAHGESFSVLNIGSDVVPGNVGLGTLTANSRISIRGTIAHEIVGHREAALMGRTQSISALEEAQASIRAARFAPDLTSTERFTLLRDGVTRLHNDGLKIRDYRDLLYIQYR